MARLVLPLIGLVEESLLAGETRAFRAPVIEPQDVQALTVGAEVAAVSIATTIELPSYVRGRWAAVARVVAVLPNELTLEGVGRARITAVSGARSPYRAELAREEPREDGASAWARTAQALLAALASGARPAEPEAARAAEQALAALMRALGGEELRAELARLPLPEAAERLAQSALADRTEEEAAARLEAILRQAGGGPAGLTQAAAHRLWSQCVEIMRRLDLHDPSRNKAGEDDHSRLERRLLYAGLTADARELADRELRMLSTMRPDHHDYTLYLRHLELLAELPWQAAEEPPLDLDRVAAALDAAHSGLDKPKQRILEHLAVRKLGGAGGSTILCLVGPAGVGKTTIAAAIAEALGTRLIRIPLGGVHDESELRGHRRSYQAAAPGRIIAGMAHAKTARPVMLLDELDKVGTDRLRSAVGALHELLDPEQNSYFQDNYLATPFDLSRVLYIATANDASAIAPTLRDRLELVELEGYTVPEKAHIARRHLLDRVRAETGLPARIELEDGVLEALVDGWAREPGVRELKRALSTLYRRRALAHARGQGDGPLTIGRAELERALGPPRHRPIALLPSLPVGVAMGLAVTADAGSVLYVEAAHQPGTGQLRLTGRLGDVMQESAHAALGHLRSEAARYGLTRDALSADVHVHVPEGALPKDGPSAGVALLLAMWSALTGRALPSDLAVTGEITLTGRVLGVGGLRAKLLAAERAGLRRVVVPAASAHDVPAQVGVEVTLIDRVDALLAQAGARPTSSGGGAARGGEGAHGDAPA